MSIFIITGPSGAGKTTVANELLDRCHILSKVVTSTSRDMREGEIDGVHYHFVSPETFFRNVHHGEFIEHAQVYNNAYGTSHLALKEAQSGGKHALIVTDVQGAEWWKDNYPEDVVTIFLLPPSHEELESRLESRGVDTVHDIQFRLDQAMDETVRGTPWARYIALNDTLESTVEGVTGFVNSVLRKRVK